MFAKNIAANSRDIFARQKIAERKAYEQACAAYLRTCKKRREYAVGDYVLLHTDGRTKLDLDWSGPYLVTDCVRDLVYEHEDLNSHVRSQAHVNRLHAFFPGHHSVAQLRNDALNLDEFFIDVVREHRIIEHRIWLRVKWSGYDVYQQDDDRSWVLYQDAKDSPAVQQYLRDHPELHDLLTSA